MANEMDKALEVFVYMSDAQRERVRVERAQGGDLSVLALLSDYVETMPGASVGEIARAVLDELPCEYCNDGADWRECSCSHR